MAIRIVEELFKNEGGHTAHVTLEAPTRAELTEMGARQAAVEYAREHGLPTASLSGLASPFPVNDRGETPEGLLFGKEPVAAYRVTYKLNAGLHAALL